MPAIAAQPVHSIQTAALIGAKPAAPKTQEQKKEAIASSLSRTDVYVNSTAQLAENAILSAFNSYSDTQAAMTRYNNKDGVQTIQDFTNVGGSVKNAAIQRTVTSSLSNGWAVVRGKVTLAEAGGRVVGDVATSAASNGLGALATNAAVWGIAKAGGSSLPVMVGGMAAGFIVNNVSHRMMGKFGVTQAITNTTTGALEALSGTSKN